MLVSLIVSAALLMTFGAAEEDAAPAPSDARVLTWSAPITWDAATGPAAREHPSVMRFVDRVVVYAGSGYEPQGAALGDAWAYDAATRTWTELACHGDVPPPAGSRRVAQAADSDVAYLFGGYGANFETNDELYRVVLHDDAVHFTRLEQIHAPAPRALHAFGLDSETNTLIVTHGVSRAGFLGDTWIGRFDDEGARVTWSRVESAAAPGPCFGSAYGVDGARGELVLWSGQTPTADGAPMPMTTDAWRLDVRAEPPTWQRLELGAAPAGRRNPMFVYDDARDRLIVWCGTADARTNLPGVVILARAANGTWAITEHSDDGAPPRRSSGTGFVDPARGVIHFGFGNSRDGRYLEWVPLNLDDASK